MSGRRDSWVKNYQDVDFDVPLSAQSKEEREAMLQSAATTTTSSPSTTPEPLATPSDLPPARPRPPKKPTSHHTTGPAQHEASSSASPPQQHLESGGAVGEHGTLSNARSPRASSFKSFASSPLNPAPAMFPSPFARPGSRGSAYMNRLVSEESRAFANNSPHTLSTSTSRGSMILYRRADGAAQPNEEGLLPPSFSHLNRNSVYSTSGDSIVSLGSDSKYPAGTIGSERGLIAYAYDPLMDELEPVTEEDNLHDPDEKDPVSSAISSLSWRGFLNIFTLVALVTALLCLFVVYPVTMAFADNGREFLITRNTRINSTGQAVPMSFDPRRSQVVIG
ncbi:hypothetical protein B0H34DRAFT_273077 [Crassisporium funariophilum]|nr:hypothetical protein B0H34DRAFT_273077 [Crassisporium funariophilum]